MMKALWSFWSEPFRAHRSAWRSERHHRLSWVLSVETARRHFSTLALCTDDAGKALLVDELGLEFDEVSTALNDLGGHNPEWWCLGKIAAYARQGEPFVHIDSDVYLWHPLPERLLRADLLAQNPETYPIRESAYQPEHFQSAVSRVGGWSPRELSDYVVRAGVHRAFCCGIFGGSRLEFIRYYASQALRLVEAPGNAAVWPLMPDRNAVNMLFEQYLLAACLQYQQRHAGSPYAGIRIECLFESSGDSWRRADEQGYTHLLGSAAKQNPEVLAQLERRVRTDHPRLYERCVRPGVTANELLSV